MKIPVVLFAYSRPAHLARVLAGLREYRVPRLVAVRSFTSAVPSV